jgi:hypothetical protein
MLRGPRLNKLVLEVLVLMKELWAVLTMLQQRLEMLQVKLEQVAKRRLNKLEHRHNLLLRVLEVLLLTQRELYNKLEHSVLKQHNQELPV